MTGKASHRGKALQKDRYNQLKAAGLCVTCKKPTSGNIRCDSCQEQRKRENTIYRLRKKLNKKTNNRQPPNGFGDFH